MCSPAIKTIIVPDTLLKWAEDPATWTRARRLPRQPRWRRPRPPRQVEDLILALFGDSPQADSRAENRDSRPEKLASENLRAENPHSRPRESAQENLADSRPPERGIDLRKYHLDVRRIFYAYFSVRLERRGYDPEDVLQEVYRGILARNAGKSAWDPTRGRGIPSYIWMVCDSVVKNYHAKHGAWDDQHRVGVYGYREDDSYGLIDLGSAGWEDPQANTAEPLEHEDAVRDLADWCQDGTWQGVQAAEYLRLIGEGMSPAEARREVGASAAVVARAEAAAREWAAEPG